MPWRVVDVNPLAGFRFSVRFLDGTTGIVDLSGLIGSPHAGVFARLADPAIFAQAFVVHGAVTWPGELILRPMRCTPRSRRTERGFSNRASALGIS